MKIFFKPLFSALLILLSAIIFSACNFDSKYDSEFFAMDTVMTVTAYGNNSENAVKSAQSEINRLDSLLSIQNENSEIYTLNSEKSIYACDDTLELVKRSKEAFKLTDGAFDITSQPLTNLWGFYSNLENRVPTKSEIENALKHVGSKYIKIDGSKITLENGACIDLGGIAKGYASKRASEILTDNGVSSAIISLGGNVKAVGSKPDGSKWNIAVADPDDNSKQAGVLSVSDKAVVTSGGYQRYFEENGQIYHHIIDTSTGYPAKSGLKSVTVVSDDDVLADALSTGFFVMGMNKAADICSKNESLFGAVFITDKNEIFITQNLNGIFSSQRSFEVIKS